MRRARLRRVVASMAGCWGGVAGRADAPRVWDALCGAGGRARRDREPLYLYRRQMILSGIVLGELIRRVDPKHRTLGAFIRDEIAIPLELDLVLGIKNLEVGRHGSVCQCVCVAEARMSCFTAKNKTRFERFDRRI